MRSSLLFLSFSLSKCIFCQISPGFKKTFFCPFFLLLYVLHPFLPPCFSALKNMALAATPVAGDGEQNNGSNSSQQHQIFHFERLAGMEKKRGETHTHISYTTTLLLLLLQPLVNQGQKLFLMYLWDLPGGGGRKKGRKQHTTTTTGIVVGGGKIVPFPTKLFAANKHTCVSSGRKSWRIGCFLTFLHVP